MNSRGNALVTVLIISAALLAVASATMTFSRSDTMVSDNTSKSVEAFWAAEAGVQVAKADLIDDYEAFILAPTPRVFTGTIGNGTYSATMQPMPNATPAAKFIIDSTGTGPQMTVQRVREIVATAQHTANFDAISIHGNGSHTKVAESGMLPVPNFTIDGRNHDRHGEPFTDPSQDPAGCPYRVSSVAADTTGANNVQEELNDLRCALVKAANSCCTAAGASQSCGSGPSCSTGLWWIRGPDATPRFGTPPSNCNTTSPPAPPQLHFPDLDLSENLLRNMSAPPAWGTPVAGGGMSPTFTGPMILETSPDTTGSPPLLRSLDTAGLNALNAQIQSLLDYAIRAPSSQKVCMPNSLPSGLTTYGSWADPKIVVIPKTSHEDVKYNELRDLACGVGATGSAAYRIDGGREVRGTGILVVPRAVVLDGGNNANPTKFFWRGLVLVLDDGDLRLGSGSNKDDVCGGVLGGIILQDGSPYNPPTSADPKMNLLEVGNHTCTNPWWDSTESAAEAWGTSTAQNSFGFHVKYSCESINRAFAGALATLAWVHRYEGE